MRYIVKDVAFEATSQVYVEPAHSPIQHGSPTRNALRDVFGSSQPTHDSIRDFFGDKEEEKVLQQCIWSRYGHVMEIMHCTFLSQTGLMQWTVNCRVKNSPCHPGESWRTAIPILRRRFRKWKCHHLSRSIWTKTHQKQVVREGNRRRLLGQRLKEGRNTDCGRSSQKRCKSSTHWETSSESNCTKERRTSHWVTRGQSSRWFLVDLMTRCGHRMVILWLCYGLILIIL